MSIPIHSLETIRDSLSSIREAEAVGEDFASGRTLLREGERTDRISLVIRGEIELLKRGDESEEYFLGTLRPGQFLGLLSLSSGTPSFFTARAKTDGALLSIPQQRFTDLLWSRMDFNQMVGPLLLGNLVDRYRRVVSLHLKVAELTRDLDAEKKELQTTIQQLEATRNRLIQQEKMATLGHLVAGIAHEINNPIASLSRAADSIQPQMERVLSGPVSRACVPVLQQAFADGLNRKALQTQEQRERLESVTKRYPDLPRSVVRTLSNAEPDALEGLDDFLAECETADRPMLIRRWLDVFEVGGLVRSVRLACDRIGHIVRSLKGYSRQERSDVGKVDLREGIRDTLVLFGYVLKRFNVVVDLPEVPPVRCCPHEINQVWTNLILNACEAMGESGTLHISCANPEPGWVRVEIHDSGPGIPPDIRKHIFENSFSTKQSSTPSGPGLGLGLAIAKGIVDKHQGRIEVRNAPERGAIFAVDLRTEWPGR